MRPGRIPPNHHIQFARPVSKGIDSVAQQQLELQFGSAINHGLFSTHWLEHRLQLEPEWTELRVAAQVELERLSEIWKSERKRVERYQGEQALEYGFFSLSSKRWGGSPIIRRFSKEGSQAMYSLQLKP
jgi:hypothetical protein